MPESEIKITNETGLHARPASQFVNKAQEYEAEIFIERVDDPEENANAKSIMDVMSMGAAKGTEIIIKTEGEDEDKALEELKEFIENLSNEES